jgi:hypothetical protein
LIAATSALQTHLQRSLGDFYRPVRSLEIDSFPFLVPIFVFLEKLSRQDALGATIPISLDL